MNRRGILGAGVVFLAMLGVYVLSASGLLVARAGDGPGAGTKPPVRLITRLDGRILRHGIQDLPGDKRVVDCMTVVELVSNEGPPVHRVNQAGHCGKGGEVTWGIDLNAEKGSVPVVALVRLYAKETTEDTVMYRLVDEQLVDLRRRTPKTTAE